MILMKILVISLTLFCCLFCQDLWEYQKQYKQGDRVKDEAGNIYQCKKWPFSGWCPVYDPKGTWASQAWQKINGNQIKSEGKAGCEDCAKSGSNDQQIQNIQLKGNKKKDSKLSQNEINNGTQTKETQNKGAIANQIDQSDSQSN